jgi:cell division protein FtsQ
VNTKKTIRKILFVTMWVVIGGAMLTLLIAAMGKQKKNTCKDYSITIKGGQGDDLFLGKSDIVRLLKASTKGNIKGQQKASFNLLQMENLLKENVWIKDAQLYFDTKDVLHVKVKERAPIARIFTVGGKSFYIDEEEQAMQLSDKRSAKVPVFTGFPDKKMRKDKDSLLLHDVKQTAAFINSHPFWASQVTQIDMAQSEADGSWEFDMVPVIGNHIVNLGNGENIEQKFNRLFIFYKQVLSRTGFDKYKAIDVRYSGQVVGRKSDNPKVDSVRLRKSVENLLQQIKKMESESEMMQKTIDENAAPIDKGTTDDDKTVNPNEVVTDKSNSNPSEKDRNNPKPTGKKTPKAVMKKNE